MSGDYDLLTLPSSMLIPIREVDAKGTLQESFEAFHRMNPHVLAAIEGLVVEMRSIRVTRWGMKGIFEVLRWQYAMQTHGEEYKLNNNYTAFYARVVEARAGNPGFFVTRRQALDYEIDWSALGMEPPVAVPPIS